MPKNGPIVLDVDGLRMRYGDHDVPHDVTFQSHQGEVLGMRSALLPAGAVHVEIGESWRHLETVGVLAGWAVLGLVVAPVVLRRMARGESGSRVAARRELALRRAH